MSLFRWFLALVAMAFIAILILPLVTVFQGR
jgi:hypothetical protein